MDAQSAILAGLLLGFSSAGYCFWSCAAVMGPYLVVTDRTRPVAHWASLPSNFRTLLFYNLGRLLSYLVTGAVISWLAQVGTTLPPFIQALARVGTAGLLAYSLMRPASENHCWRRGHRHAGAFTMGMLQGFSPCPPFVAAVGIGLSSHHPFIGLLVFGALFFSTALYTLPLAFIEPLRRKAWLTWLVRILGLLVCFYLVISGIWLFFSVPGD